MKRHTLIQEQLTRSVIGAFYEAYNSLGFGFMEHVYSMALERVLLSRGHRVGREVSVIVYFQGEELCRQRLDMVVDETLVVEIKSTFDLRHGARDQLYSYLRATDLEVGLLLHFGPKAKFYRVISTNAVERSARSAGSAESGNV